MLGKSIFDISFNAWDGLTYMAKFAGGNFRLRIIESWYKFHSSLFNRQLVIIGSDNGFKPNRRQTPTCTDYDPIHWGISVLPGLN